MQDPSTMDYKHFKDSIIDTLNKHVSLKRKYLRANHSNFITKELSKAIMQRSKLRNLYLKVRSAENKIRYKKERKGVFSTVLTDLPKAFECLPHQFLIAKLSAYGFDIKSMAFISVYLKNRKQKTQIGSTFRECLNILFGVPQGSILGPLFF